MNDRDKIHPVHTTASDDDDDDADITSQKPSKERRERSNHDREAHKTPASERNKENEAVSSGERALGSVRNENLEGQDEGKDEEGSCVGDLVARLKAYVEKTKGHGQHGDHGASTGQGSEGGEVGKDVDERLSLLTALKELGIALVDGETEAKDVFRQSGGFEALLEILDVRTDCGARETLITDVEAVLDTFTRALKGHQGNRRYFAYLTRRTVEGMSKKWDRVGSVLDRVWCVFSQASGSDVNQHARLLGSLLALATDQTGEDKLKDIFSQFEYDGPAEKENGVLVVSNRDSAYGEEQAVQLRNHAQRFFTGNELIRNPEAVTMFTRFWRIETTAVYTSGYLDLLVLVLIALTKLASMSLFNLVAMHSSGIQSDLLYFINNPDHPIKSTAQELFDVLLTLGLDELKDAHHLVSEAYTSPKKYDVISKALTLSTGPSFIQFDSSVHGYCSLELPSLGKQFPPTPTAGFTFSTWLRIDKFDATCHTTIFGAFDPTQACFMLAYIDKESHLLIWQTSIKSLKPSIKFKSIAFKAGCWYHLALVHRRPRTLSSSRATLFVNGEFVEQQKIHYPAYVEGTSIQAFLGTPKELSVNRGQNTVSSSWSLASFHLIADALSDEFIMVQHKLGPNYTGNYQDALGPFQTYRASAELYLRNEMLHPGKEETSQIVSAIKYKAGALYPENLVLLSICPHNFIDISRFDEDDQSQLGSLLSKSTIKKVQQHLRSKGDTVVVNGAIPSISNALMHAHGTALPMGEPTVAISNPLYDQLRCVGGCVAVGLHFVKIAKTKDAVLSAVDIVFRSVHSYWRNSEAMESENGFGILAGLLSAKVGLSSDLCSGNASAAELCDVITGGIEEQEDLAAELLKLILSYTGLDEKSPENSMLINPLAYRVLLVDCDFWRMTRLSTQQLYLGQFSSFVKGNKHYRFNCKRLARMRITRKFIDALKSEQVAAASLEKRLDAFKVTLECALTADNLRSIALFITFILRHARTAKSRSGRSGTFNSREQTRASTPLSDVPVTPQGGSDNDNKPPSLWASGTEIGVGLLTVLADLLCKPDSTGDIKRFAKTVTNKWLIYLLAEPDARVVTLAMKILARVLVLNGPSYVKKFSDPNKNSGFLVLKNRLRRWYHVPALWVICFAIFFGVDIAKVELDRRFTVDTLLAALGFDKLAIVNPEIFPVVAAMLSTGLKKVLQDIDGELTLRPISDETLPSKNWQAPLGTYIHEEGRETYQNDSNEDSLIQCMISFLTVLQRKSDSFREYAATSGYVQELLFILFPIVVNSENVKAETELNSRGSALTFQGQDVIMRPRSTTETSLPPVVRTSVIEESITLSSSPDKKLPLKRASSFVLITSEKSKATSSQAKLDHIMSPRSSAHMEIEVEDALVNDLVNVVILVFKHQVLERKEFQGLGLFLRVPPGFQERQAYFESFLFLHVIAALTKEVKGNSNILSETRVLSNMARYVIHMSEAVFEGWFIDGAEPLIDFTGTLLDYLQRPAVSKLKSVQLCSQQVSSIRTVFLRTVLMRLSELNGSQNPAETVSFLEKITYWQTVILSPDNNEAYLQRLLCYLLYADLVSVEEEVRNAAATFWRLFLVQKPVEISAMFKAAATVEQRHLCDSFPGLSSLDNSELLTWIDSHRQDLDAILHTSTSKLWDGFVADENRSSRETAKHRVSKRRDRLRQWQADEEREERQWRYHSESTDYWRNNVYTSERLKYQRSLQDQQENLNAIRLSLNRYEKQLRDPCDLIYYDKPARWQLDETEGRNRMRLRVIPYEDSIRAEYLSKQKSSQIAAQRPRGQSRPEPSDVISFTSVVDAPQIEEQASQNNRYSGSHEERSDSPAVLEDDFEVINNPRDDTSDSFEDKNRKVMRSLRHGDQVRHVCNVSRVVGLEAYEGLLLLGKRALYLLDGFFQRSDGEIVRAWQAPQEERDSYLQLLSGQGNGEQQKTYLPLTEQNNRDWDWNELISVSRRRFLFRDVALEIFFDDGRSYLLNSISTEARDNLYVRLSEHAPRLKKSSSGQNTSDNDWRLESLRSPEDVPQGFGSKFVNVFNTGPLNAAARKWARGEMSNFHYLMLLNTMAGRTFNDLTQYPVFPWVLADYSSAELDLTDPRSFRDLSKPMGCQSPQREAEFRERYETFAEMSDSPPFHYGTHYSSAMIVSSYLIRLQPFVQSYLLLQGGNFDHAERLFHSIENAWLSASRTNMSDVRELTPEFYYLPDLLVNVNNFDFGVKQETGEKIDNVALPPWAKGDPDVFIAKHREALESEHVSRNLHKWIDLVFGFKQRGEAAIEATNVFHYLSYRGARNLDEIEDPVERAATIGIIHNFGQTPHQVCPRSHIPKEESAYKSYSLDSVAEFLASPNQPLTELREKVGSLQYLARNDRLLASTPFRLFLPPSYDRYMEWGYTDGSVRFFTQDHKKLLGLFEQIHQLQLTCARLAGSKVLVTAGTDCTISAWTIISSSKAIDLQPKGTLYGHLGPVVILEVSEAFSTLLSASADGAVLLWDLNRLKFVRKLKLQNGSPQCAKINNITGRIAICSREGVSVYTLNAKLILKERIGSNGCVDAGGIANSTVDTTGESDAGAITTCAFYEGVGNEWLVRELLFTGHKDGKVNIWNITCGAASGQWHLDFVKCLHPVAATVPGAVKPSAVWSTESLAAALPNGQRDQPLSQNKTAQSRPSAAAAAAAAAAAVTCILPTAQSVYVGDEDGRVFEWSIPKDVAKRRT